MILEYVTKNFQCVYMYFKTWTCTTFVDGGGRILLFLKRAEVTEKCPKRGAEVEARWPV